jgi:hypothetical protein
MFSHLLRTEFVHSCFNLSQELLPLVMKMLATFDTAGGLLLRRNAREELSRLIVSWQPNLLRHGFVVRPVSSAFSKVFPHAVAVVDYYF